ncbi:Putative cerato-ulmin hydrophobin family, Hydrophobin superfamily [Septoria linicola]|uniref:Cerato-ulmin hydrophobin family, Hydrophobin superfamily n=1 Tax=Septoria linicola TaxID=215465 RepID=A0A9Q9AKD6_9PEZI|nr:putative cerato-ulmin hydrophobin family, Hydrophobin superfamily [Septoria linicola]USW50929.1 Putative cerato-ulmin hydrophobin family, Hydrophobin superfamily [Septoria linicola]
MNHSQHLSKEGTIISRGYQHRSFYSPPNMVCPICLALTLTAAGAVASSLIPRQESEDNACSHRGSTPLCCPEKGDQIIAQDCVEPNDKSSPEDFRKACSSVKLNAFCCTTANGRTGVICAPGGQTPLKDRS